MKHISSRDNARFKAWRALAGEEKERRRQGRTLLDGVHLVQTWLERVGGPETLLVSESALAHDEIAALLGRYSGLEVVSFPEALFRQLSPVETPTGILAEICIPVGPTGVPRTSCVLLDGVQDPGNVGSILRSAAAAGVKDVLLTRGCARAWSPKVLRAAMGAHCFLAIREDCDPLSALAGYQGQLLATRLDPAALSLYALDLAGPVCWLFGSEGAGLSAPVSELATGSVLIPMPGGMESLNVAAAAAVCLFEEMRQKGTGRVAR